ncbi:uncharacterized protein V1510DRAFT_439400 [Dipodascopsis tothii]|uniref:uncharacterized protein n=1 Tax=Dipodascopsis tothii TaxID=44089 RepID=UPI0034CD53D7
MACLKNAAESYLDFAHSSPALGALGLLLLSLGAYTYATISFAQLKFLLELTVVPGKKLAQYKKKGSWAVVTGASDGIGKEFATQLAKAGFSVVLVSRTKAKLDALATEIESKYGVSTEVVPFDFATVSDGAYDALERTIAPLDVSVLINNVGQSHSIPVAFAETSVEEMSSIININNIGTLRVTRIVLPKLIAQRGGLVLTMGSFGGMAPSPLLAVYSGSKAFLEYWNTSMAAELAPYKVDSYVVFSYLVTSAMSKVRKTSLMIPNPKSFVASTLANIGLTRGVRPYTMIPYWSHAILGAGMRLLPASVLRNQTRSMHVNIRKRALRKAERERKGQ